MLKFNNDTKTAAVFNGVSLTLDKPENWVSIGDTPTREAVLAWLAAGNKPLPVDPPGAGDLVARYEALLDQHLDAVAQKYRYADRTRLALRAGYPNEHQPLAVAFGAWMDQSCNRPAKLLMLDVMAGKKPMPSEAEFIAGLPLFVPPAGY